MSLISTFNHIHMWLKVKLFLTLSTFYKSSFHLLIRNYQKIFLNVFFGVNHILAIQSFFILNWNDELGTQYCSLHGYPEGSITHVMGNTPSSLSLLLCTFREFSLLTYKMFLIYKNHFQINFYTFFSPKELDHLI